MAKRKKMPTDLNQRAKAIVDFATSDDEPAVEKDEAAVSLGRRGGLKGGKARAEKLTPEQRSAIARKAAQGRWGKGSGS
jgi:hypothetical protein